MKKIYKLGLTLGATLSIVAPISTIACGNSHNKVMPHQGKNTDTKIKWTTLDSTTNKPGQTLKKPASLDSKPWTNIDRTTNVPFDIMKASSYTYDSLKAEAVKIGNNAQWRHGLSYEATLNGIALIRALAEINGYDQETYFNEIGAISIDENNNVINRDFNTQKSTPWSDMNAWVDTSASDFKTKRDETVEKFKKLSVKNTKPTDIELKNINQLFGSMDGTKITTLLSERSWIDVSQVLPTDLDFFGPQGAKPYVLKVYSYIDYKNPGNLIVKLYDPAYRVVKTFTLKGLVEKYPVISEADKYEFKPFVEVAIKKFIETFIPNSGLISKTKPGMDEQINMFEYVTNKFSVRNHDGDIGATITNDTLEKLWDQINNGSINLQAIKLFGIGIDYDSFKTQQGVDKNVFVNDKGPISNGLRDMGALDILNWFSEAKGKTPVFTDDYANWK